MKYVPEEILQTTAGIEISEAQRAILAHDEATRGQLSDGYHSFDELYEHRLVLFVALCNQLAERGGKNLWKSRRHADKSEWSGWFIAGIGKKPGETVTYHLPNRLFDFLYVPELAEAPEWDGHTPNDVLKRLSDMFFAE